MKNTDTAEEVKETFKVRVHEFVYNLLQQILFAVLPMRTEIGYNTIYCVSPLKTGNNSSVTAEPRGSNQPGKFRLRWAFLLEDKKKK